MHGLRQNPRVLTPGKACAVFTLTDYADISRNPSRAGVGGGGVESHVGGVEDSPLPIPPPKQNNNNNIIKQKTKTLGVQSWNPESCGGSAEVHWFSADGRRRARELCPQIACALRPRTGVAARAPAW